MWRGWLDFVRAKGGCRGHELDWDADGADAPEGGYDVQTRVRAEAAAREMIERIRAQWLPNLEPFEDDDDEGEVDQREWPGREAE